MKVERKGKSIVITLPAEWDSKTLSTSGKSFNIAGSNGAQRIPELDVAVNVNVYRKNPDYVKPE